MRDPLLRSLFVKKYNAALRSDGVPDSWLNRVRENLAQLLLPSPFKPSSANGAPLHLLQLDKSQRPARAQTASLLTHAAIISAFLLVAWRVPHGDPPHPFQEPTPLTRYAFPTIRTTDGPHPSDGSGSGGNHNPIIATSGELFPRSSVQLVRPTLPENRTSILPEPPTILDPNAPPILASVEKPGLPWMSKESNSPGPGAHSGIGSGPGGTLGDGVDGPLGRGYDSANYGPGFVPPTCAYCPYPTYSDDARKAKVQGAVTLRVLIGTDGRAQEVRIIQGIGFGLDERAIETVRNWKSIPARDSAKRPVASWVTVEALFRLF